MRSDGARATSQAQVWTLIVIAVILAGWALHVMAVVFVPIVCAIFVALVVFPLDAWIAARTPDRLAWIGHLVALGVVLLAIGLFFGSIWLAAERVEQQVPETLPALGQILQSGGSEAGAAAAEGGTGAEGAQLLSQFERALGQAQQLLGGYGVQLARTLLASAGTILGGLVLIVFLTLLMLVEQPRWHAKLDTLQGSSAGEWLHTVGTVAAKIRRYLLARTILGLLTAVLYAAWLWIFGVDLLLVWGLLAFVLNYIPNLGSLISGTLPVLYAFLTRDLQTALLVGAGILAIEQVVGNFVDPRLQARQVSVSPVLVLVVLLLWGWIWGVAGAILAVPITVTALVFFAHVPALRPLALLLSRERDMAGLSEATGT